MNPADPAMRELLRLTVSGRIVPYVRMTQRSKFGNPAAVRYNADQTRIRWELKTQMSGRGWEMIPRGAPLAVEVVVTMTGRLRCQDIDNQAKAVLDALQGVVIEDDRWVDHLRATRELGAVDRVEVTVRRHVPPKVTGQMGQEAVQATAPADRPAE